MCKKITCVNDLLNELKMIFNDKLFNYQLWYRGYSDEGWELSPSVQRKNYANKEVEQFMTNDFYSKRLIFDRFDF